MKANLYLTKKSKYLFNIYRNKLSSITSKITTTQHFGEAVLLEEQVPDVPGEGAGGDGDQGGGLQEELLYHSPYHKGLSGVWGQQTELDVILGYQ